MTEEDAFVGEDAAGGEGRLGAYVQPSQSPLCVEDDGSGIGVRIVRSELLDEATVTRCAGICHYNVEECEILLTVAL